MFWQEDTHQHAPQVPDDVVDLLFSIDCRELPVDHAYHLSQALRKALPSVADDPRVSVHTVHVAGSQNGWERPDHSTDERLILSRRTKLVIRVPRELAAEVEKQLRGSELDVNGCRMQVKDAKSRPLSKQGTIFARYVVLEDGEDADEMRFLQRVAGALAERGIHIKKALCGKTTYLTTPDGPVATRSLMLANLSVEESVQLQQEGLGPLRDMGCGIFIPHKGIDAVKSASEDD